MAFNRPGSRPGATPTGSSRGSFAVRPAGQRDVTRDAAEQAMGMGSGTMDNDHTGAGDRANHGAASGGNTTGPSLGRRLFNLSTVIAVSALTVSGYSLYVSSLAPASVTAYVTPVMQYADPANGPFEIFTVPLAFSNAGAQTGTVTSIALTVTNLKSGAKKRFYSAATGSWADRYANTAPDYTPVSIPGYGSFASEVIFYPVPDPVETAGAGGNEEGQDATGTTSESATQGKTKTAPVERIIDLEAGAYAFELCAQIVAGPPFWAGLSEALGFDGTPSPGCAPDTGTITTEGPASTQAADRNVQQSGVKFTRSIRGLDYRAFQNGGTLQMTGF